jgi:hypothetical protein
MFGLLEPGGLFKRWENGWIVRERKILGQDGRTGPLININK